MASQSSAQTPSAQPCWSNLTESQGNDRGLFYGDGLFETVAVVGHSPRLLGRHLQRLKSSALALGLEFEDKSQQALISDIERGLKESALSDGVLKIVLSRAAEHRGYWPDPAAGSHMHVFFYRSGEPPATPEAPGGKIAPLRLGLCRTRLARQPALAGLKHLNRLEQVLARREWRSGIDEGLMLDSQGALVEATASNLFLLTGKNLVTPRLDQCGVAGVMRSWLQDNAGALGLVTEQRRVDLEELQGCEAVLLTNAVMGVVAVTEYVGPIGEIGEAKHESARRYSPVGGDVAHRCQRLLAQQHAQESSEDKTLLQHLTLANLR